MRLGREDFGLVWFIRGWHPTYPSRGEVMFIDRSKKNDVKRAKLDFEGAPIADSSKSVELYFIIQTGSEDHLDEKQLRGKKWMELDIRNRESKKAAFEWVLDQWIAQNA